MTWRALITALDTGGTFRSRVSVYMHPLAGRPIGWHVVRALAEVDPAPSSIHVLHHSGTQIGIPDDMPMPVTDEIIEQGDEERALRAACTSPGLKVLVDGAAPLLESATISRLLRAAENGVAALTEAGERLAYHAVAGEGPALASAADPRYPPGAIRVAPTTRDELIRVVDRATLSRAVCAMRDRLVRMHEERGVTFLLPATSLVDTDVTIGTDTVIYPGVVIEGATSIGNECVIGPYSHVVEARIGRGVELQGWNYVTHTALRNHSVLEAYARRGFD
jgi:bifunctional N-acetylglucosamine-1-phosphate-uridyltransferase/glucosamine-1-phosphate-acetyltransferase GlmU-like protein